jgi:hypothetical protein
VGHIASTSPSADKKLFSFTRVLIRLANMDYVRSERLRLYFAMQRSRVSTSKSLESEDRDAAVLEPAAVEDKAHYPEHRSSNQLDKAVDVCSISCSFGAPTGDDRMLLFNKIKSKTRLLWRSLPTTDPLAPDSNYKSTAGN